MDQSKKILVGKLKKPSYRLLRGKYKKLNATMPSKKSQKRVFGILMGKLSIPKDFNDESDEINDMFYGK